MFRFPVVAHASGNSSISSIVVVEGQISLRLNGLFVRNALALESSEDEKYLLVQLAQFWDRSCGELGYSLSTDRERLRRESNSVQTQAKRPCCSTSVQLLSWSDQESWKGGIAWS